MERENIEYLVCSACGVVFPDRENPHACPICALSGNTANGFLPYVNSVSKSETRA